MCRELRARFLIGVPSPATEINRRCKRKPRWAQPGSRAARCRLAAAMGLGDAECCRSLWSAPLPPILRKNKFVEESIGSQRLSAACEQGASPGRGPGQPWRALRRRAGQLGPHGHGLVNSCSTPQRPGKGSESPKPSPGQPSPSQPSVVEQRGSSRGTRGSGCPRLLPARPGTRAATGGSKPSPASAAQSSPSCTSPLMLRLPGDRTGISCPEEAGTSPTRLGLGCSAIGTRCPSNRSNCQAILNTLCYPAPARAASQAAGILYNPPKDQQTIFHSCLSPQEKERDLGSIVIRVNCSF